jgi:hypothetical protein
LECTWRERGKGAAAGEYGAHWKKTLPLNFGEFDVLPLRDESAVAAGNTLARSFGAQWK